MNFRNILFPLLILITALQFSACTTVDEGELVVFINAIIWDGTDQETKKMLHL